MMNYWVNSKLSFDNFCKITHIMHPKKGFVPFVLYDYQNRLADLYDTERYVIVKKFRQGGFTTMTTLYLLYKCLTGENVKAAILTRTGYESNYLNTLAKSVLEYFTIDTDKYNQWEIRFKSGSHMIFRSPEACRGCSLDYVFFDEPAFWENADTAWKSVYPCLANTNGKAFVASTPNRGNGWFYETYRDALEGKNSFKIFACSFDEHPDYNNQEWIDMIRKNLGQKGWRQEVLAQFLGGK